MEKLTVQNLSFSYLNHPVLQGVSFGVQAGSSLGILGPNGSGKTTLLRCISGYLKPQPNTICLDEQYDILGFSGKQLAKRMALVPQHAFIAYDFTVEDIVLMGRNPHRRLWQHERQEDIAAAQAAMEWTDLIGLRKRSVLSLSGGEWQRVIIARAICQNSDLLLLDEPVSNLDIAHQMAILSIVQRLCLERGVTCILVLHDLNLAAQYCQELLLLRQGSVFAMGPPEVVLTEENIQAVYGVEVSIRQEQGAPHVVPRYR